MSPNKPTLEAQRRKRGMESHYEDADLYRRTYARRKHDVAAYLACAQELGGPILEIGAGAGRVALPLAESGFDVLAMERMQSMREVFAEEMQKASADARSRISLVGGDVNGRNLGIQLKLIVAPFNVLNHCFDRIETENLLAFVHAHLKSRGWFVFDIANPDLRAFLRDPSRGYRSPDVVHPKTKERFRYFEYFDYAADLQRQWVNCVFVPTQNPNAVVQRPLGHRQFYPLELEAMLHYNGFEMVHHYGDFERGEYHRDAETQYVWARKKQ